MDGIRWSCPHCRARLVSHSADWSCLGCRATFRSLRGIPDLRAEDDHFLSNEDDWSIALRLNEDFDRLDFRDLLDRYFDLVPDVDHSLKARQVTHILTAPGRARRWVEGLGRCEEGPILDLGCGTGSFLAAVGHSATAIGGVDIAMRWLIVARKRLEEEGLALIPLACACAERLPVADRSVAGVVAGDVIEHVADQKATLAEAYRVLAPGGRVFMASPNRYSIAPEPHVEVWGVGYLPRRWMTPYVRWRRGLDFRAIRTMGYAEWTRLLRESPFGGGTIAVPPLPRDDLAHFGTIKRSIARVYNAVVATAPGRWAARGVGPLFHVVCEKPNSVPDTPMRSSSPAIRRRSTRSAIRS